MPQKIQKTNVCRLLDAAGIAYELVEYAVDESDLSATHATPPHPARPDKLRTISSK